MVNALYPATAIHGSVVLPFVIPSAAEGSAVPRTIPGNVFDRVVMALRAPQGDEKRLLSLVVPTGAEGPAVNAICHAAAEG